MARPRGKVATIRRIIGPTLDERVAAWEKRMAIEREKERAAEEFRTHYYYARGFKVSQEMIDDLYGLAAGRKKDINGLDDWDWLLPATTDLWLPGHGEDDE